MNKTKRRANKRSLKTSPLKKKKAVIDPFARPRPGYFLNEYGYEQPISTLLSHLPRRRASRRNQIPLITPSDDDLLF